MKEMKTPTESDDLIEYLMERLEITEKAWFEMEDVITNEKAKRLQLINEWAAEKKTIKERIHAELEKTLNAALQAKVKAEDELKSKVDECIERDMMCEELDHQFNQMRAKTVKMGEMEQEAKTMNDELEQLRNENKSLKEENQKCNEDVEEAFAVIKKLDEARYTLNRLLGPNGVLNEREKKKFLKQRGEEEEYDEGEQNHPGMTGQGSNGGGAVNKSSRNMLGSNNDYFFDGQQNKEGGGGQENNDDDFWYGAPKGGAYEQQQPVGGGEYQSYIGNTQPIDPSSLQKPGSKRSGKGYRR